MNTHFDKVIKNGPFPIRFPNAGELNQDQEWCEVQIDGQWKKIRFHDYNQVYNIPGLYETIFYRTLMCNSPNRMSSLLNDVLEELHVKPEKLKVLDFGAGNGMSGEALHNIGVREIVAVDILEEAKKANWRDRPWVYSDYYVCDFTDIPSDTKEELKSYRFNALTTIAALGFGDIPLSAFINAFNLVEKGGLICINIRDEFFKKSGESDFSKLIHQMLFNETIEIELLKRYQHRLNVHGEPLYYMAIVAKKHLDLD